MKTFTDLGTEIGALVEQKNAAYGSSFAVAGDFLRLLFPNGITADRFDDALLMVRIFDKQMRIATDKDAFGESPYQDIAGYGILGLHLHLLHLHLRKKESTSWPGSASAPDASSSSKAQPASADNSTRETTTTSASAMSGGKLLQQLKDSLALCEDVPAATATELANASAAVLRYERNEAGCCALCGSPMKAPHPPTCAYPDGSRFQYCSFRCANTDLYGVSR